MRKLLFIYFALLSALVVSAAAPIDSLLHVLDKTVKERSKYVDEKNERLDILKKELEKTPDLEQKFDLSLEIFTQYKTFQMDSALFYAYKRIEIANELNDPAQQRYAQLNLAEALIITGMYKEAFEILQAEGNFNYNKEQKSYLYHIYHSLYLLMADYTLSLKERE
ncbi:MAG: hypothetical protein LIP01_06845 [Tannerellaceae bacterium]|nr:hypothetical protein [Tannerellaceae bacterium]